MIIPLIKDKLNDLLDKQIIVVDGVSVVKSLEQVCYDRIRSLENCTFTNDDGDTDILMFNNIFKVSVKLFDSVTNNVLVSNLMSIDRVRKILQQETNHIIYIFIGYKLDVNDLTITHLYINNIENINWDCLTIQNLGKGQLQMKNNSEPITFNDNVTRKDWLDELKKQAINYYDKMILKITEYKMELEKEN